MHMPKLRKTSPYIKSPLNYTGGKFRLLPQLLPHFPDNADVFVDLFCGGASVGLNARAGNVILNDIDSHVTGILEMFRNMPPEDIVTAVENTVAEYGLSDSAAIDMLPRIQQTVMRMRLAEGMEYKDIALLVSTSEQNVRQILSRARKAVLKNYTEQ